MFSWDFPIDTEGIIEDADTTISLWMIELIALILEDGCFRENGETMGKALWNEELAMIVLCQLYRYMLAIRWRSLTNIYCYIKYSTLYAAYQFALGIRWALEVQASHHTIAAHRLVVLHEVDTMPKDGRYLLIEFSL